MKNISSKPVTKCQISNSKKLKSLIFLGFLPPVNTLRKIGSTLTEEKSFPAELLYCSKSKLAQLGCIVNKEILFPYSYPYTSSTTRILRENFADLYKDTKKKIKIKKDDLIIDIGSNDGNLLSNFKENHKVLGVTPEKIGKIAIKKGIPTIIDYFDEKISKKIIRKYGKAKIITATNVFAHIDNINSIIKSIIKTLKHDGIFISESHYLLPLIKTVQYDTIYHEHQFYHSAFTLKKIFEKHSLKVFDADEINTHGGSLRIYVKKNLKIKIDKSVKSLLIEEEKFGIKKYQTYINFGKDVYKIRENVKKNILKLKKNNSKIIGYGSPAKATTALNFFGISKEIDCIVEDNKLKHGKFLPGVKIPIVSKSFVKNKPDYALVLAWNFINEIERKNIDLAHKFISIKDLEN